MFIRKLRPKQDGFTFVEMMVTVVILALGIVGLFKSLLICLNYVNHLAYRSQALILLNHKIEVIQKQYNDHQRDFSYGNIQERVDINNKRVNFVYTINAQSVDELTSLLQLDVTISWKEKDQWKQLQRSVYLSNLTSVENTPT